MAQKKLVVIGGGAAGFFCAVNAARLNTDVAVVLLEKSSKLLSKVKVSGGGRCNVTHACSGISDMARNYPRGSGFLKKSFHHFFVDDTIQWFEERGVLLKTESDGRMFPVTDDSQTIIDCLLGEAAAYKVDVRLRTEAKQIKKEGELFLIDTGTEILKADAICIAIGGLSSKESRGWLMNAGHKIIDPVPSLFTFNIPHHPITELKGISVENVEVKIKGTSFRQSGPLLITHWGLSGPAVLKLSAWAARELFEKKYHFQISVNWLPDYHENSLLEKIRLLRFDLARQKMMNNNPFGLPARLWQFLLEETGIPADMRWADLPAREQNKLATVICGFSMEVSGKTTFKEEFVTAGGVDLMEVNAATMESKRIPGLYFAGEVLDIDGVTGGFNFQNAWTGGMLAARAVAGNVKG